MRTNFSFRTEPKYFKFIFTPILFIIYSALALAIIRFGGLIGLIIVVVILSFFAFYINKRGIKKVSFQDSEINIHYMYNYKAVFNYNDILKVSEQSQGFIPYSLVVVKLKKNKENKSKFHFYCPNNEKVEFKNFLKTKKIKSRI